MAKSGRIDRWMRQRNDYVCLRPTKSIDLKLDQAFSISDTASNDAKSLPLKQYMLYRVYEFLSCTVDVLALEFQGVEGIQRLLKINFI
jgi:hypothetical protein